MHQSIDAPLSNLPFSLRRPSLPSPPFNQSARRECDAACQTQVKLLEGGILFFILAVTVG